MASADPSIKHPEYLQFAPEWEMIRDVIAGEEDVKQKGQRYLHRELGMNTGEYHAFKEGAFFLPACARTVDASVGMIHRKAATIEGQEPVPDEAWAAITQNFSRRGVSIHDVAYLMTDEVVALNRVGLLLEYPPVQKGLSRLQFDALNILPYVRIVKAEDIINWRERELPNGRTILDLVVLAAHFSQRDPNNEFDTVTVERYYVHDLVDGSTVPDNERSNDLIYRKRTFTKNDKGSWDVEEGFTKIRNETLSRIPFWFAGGYGSPSVSRSPLVSIASTNLKQYRLSAQLNWGLKFVALPTPYVAGVADRAELEVADPVSGMVGIPIGPSFFHVVRNADAKFGLLEYTGKGLELLQKEIETRRDEMAMLGSRMLSSEKRMIETAETARIYRVGENAALSLVAESVSRAITEALRTALIWIGINPESLNDLKYTLNRDYLPSEMDANMYLNLYKSYLEGALPLMDFFGKLKEGEIIDPERDLEEFEDDLEESRRSLGLAGADTRDAGSLGGQQNVAPGETRDGIPDNTTEDGTDDSSTRSGDDAVGDDVPN
jgi:hypothetical protein